MHLLPVNDQVELYFEIPVFLKPESLLIHFLKLQTFMWLHFIIDIVFVVIYEFVDCFLSGFNYYLFTLLYFI